VVPHLHKTRKFDTRRLEEGHGPHPANAPKRIAASFYQLKSGHALTATHMKRIKKQEDQCWWYFRSKHTPGAIIQALLNRPQQNAMWACWRKRPSVASESGAWPNSSRREVQRSDTRVHTYHGCGEKDSGYQGRHGERVIGGGARMPLERLYCGCGPGATEAIEADGSEGGQNDQRRQWLRTE